MSDPAQRRLARLARLRAVAERAAVRLVATLAAERDAVALLATRLGQIIGSDRRATGATLGWALAAAEQSSARARRLRDVTLARLAAVERQLSDAERAMLLARGQRDAALRLLDQRRGAAQLAADRREGERTGSMARSLQ